MRIPVICIAPYSAVGLVHKGSRRLAHVCNQSRNECYSTVVAHLIQFLLAQQRLAFCPREAFCSAIQTSSDVLCIRHTFTTRLQRLQMCIMSCCQLGNSKTFLKVKKLSHSAIVSAQGDRLQYAADSEDSQRLAKEAAQLLLVKHSPNQEKCSEGSRRACRGSRHEAVSRMSHHHNSTQTLPGSADSAELTAVHVQSKPPRRSRRALDFCRSNGEPEMVPDSTRPGQVGLFGVVEDTISAAMPSGPDGLHPSRAARALGLDSLDWKADSLHEEHMSSLLASARIRTNSVASSRALKNRTKSCIRATPW